MKFFSSINYVDSFSLTKLAFQFFSKNKDLNLFPLAFLVLNLALVGAFVGVINADLSLGWTVFTYSLLALFYLLTSFLMSYFNIALTAITLRRLSNQPASLKLGFSYANRCLASTLYWSNLAATFGLIIHTIEILFSRLFKLKNSPIQFSWTTSAYFIFPIMVMEQKHPRQALKRSAELVGQGFKSTVSMKSLLALFFILILMSLTEFLLDSPPLFFQGLWLIVPVFILAAGLILTLEKIVISALYLNAHQKEAIGFNKALLDRVFIKECP